jgi:hypothetical protein
MAHLRFELDLDAAKSADEKKPDPIQAVKDAVVV